MDEFDEPDDEFEDEGEEPMRLDRREAEQVRRDLEDLDAIRQTFEPDGFKGVSVFCPDCAEEHYYEWDMFASSLSALLESGETPVHEPAFDPHPDDYVGWEYAQGFLDGLSEAGVPAAGAEALADGACPFCGSELPERGTHASYCPACGQHLGPARIAAALFEAGWSPESVSALLRAARIPPMRGTDGGSR
ncbi:DUF5319 family protein [Egibacter rhizosphaerae]|uniref:DUF5319 family protein n=1 Tax=Egibacter rhizosphaerae TaxID=1670831 RepID=UPI0013F156CC|nr:DUF5319 family protein [Egibacter rhizosphaerae]